MHSRSSEGEPCFLRSDPTFPLPQGTDSNRVETTSATNKNSAVGEIERRNGFVGAIPKHIGGLEARRPEWGYHSMCITQAP